MKGDINDICNRTVCNNGKAVFYNHSTRKYYCPKCARLINEMNPEALEMYGHPLCTKEIPNPEVCDATTDDKNGEAGDKINPDLTSPIVRADAKEIAAWAAWKQVYIINTSFDGSEKYDWDSIRPEFENWWKEFNKINPYPLGNGELEVYVPVSVEDELPPVGERFFALQYENRKNDFLIQYEKYRERFVKECGITHWLKKVKASSIKK